jgi:hypothetical protein
MVDIKIGLIARRAKLKQLTETGKAVGKIYCDFAIFMVARRLLPLLY